MQEEEGMGKVNSIAYFYQKINSFPLKATHSPTTTTFFKVFLLMFFFFLFLYASLARAMSSDRSSVSQLGKEIFSFYRHLRIDRREKVYRVSPVPYQQL